MTVDYLVLSDVPLHRDLLNEVGAAVVGDGAVIHLGEGEPSVFIDERQHRLATVFPTKPIHIATEARASIVDAPEHFALWTEVTVPVDADARGHELAAAIAGAVDGTIRKRG